jgi:hypothetical protein
VVEVPDDQVELGRLVGAQVQAVRQEKGDRQADQALIGRGEVDEQDRDAGVEQEPQPPGGRKGLGPRAKSDLRRHAIPQTHQA